ncbi:Retrovirus-related Pol polyprotein from transposon TNT 1-94 [Araneus ventricosus]|uniref:Retrovirus-related Pol polyprotein from transposon TNT 1-94 n=1 Tax=Araneus ventricosus TaxID=182803 RepID=A0A4Y2VRT7_ARAVE|nr:Retrovirus-related Pol polyprotein from transposon TNT 1-94 [Araneus ventricosus]
MDLWGPSPTKSLGGNSYFLSVIDDFFMYAVVYPIKKKSDVFNCFSEYLVNSERQLGRKLKCVRSDNCFEFCNKQFESYLKSLGIKMERTTVYTPEQNGVAERFNRSVIEGIRAMLQDSGLHARFWAEALQTFVHIRNRCEHKFTKNISPTEIWTGRKPSLRHFKIFGSIAYAYTPSIKRNKLQNKADIGIFVGYARKTKGYRIWLLRKKDVIKTIHAKIDESKNGVMTSFGQKSQEYVQISLSGVYFSESTNDQNVF